jgi:hypothetical protein
MIGSRQCKSKTKENNDISIVKPFLFTMEENCIRMVPFRGEKSSTSKFFTQAAKGRRKY